MFQDVIDSINVRRPGMRRARARPDTVMGDKAYSSSANRALLRPENQSHHPRAQGPDRQPQT